MNTDLAVELLVLRCEIDRREEDVKKFQRTRVIKEAEDVARKYRKCTDRIRRRYNEVHELLFAEYETGDI